MKIITILAIFILLTIVGLLKGVLSYWLDPLSGLLIIGYIAILFLGFIVLAIGGLDVKIKQSELDKITDKKYRSKILISSKRALYHKEVISAVVLLIFQSVSPSSSCTLV